MVARKRPCAGCGDEKAVLAAQQHAEDDMLQICNGASFGHSGEGCVHLGAMTVLYKLHSSL